MQVIGIMKFPLQPTRQGQPQRIEAAAAAAVAVAVTITVLAYRGFLGSPAS